jgi:hypothetical protein
MWVRGVGVVAAAVLFRVGLAWGQQAAPVSPGGSVSQAYDWLSPAPLTWNQPETFNWSTSPVKLNAHESGGYNSNILNSAPSTVLPPGQTRGDYLLTSIIGASSKFNAWSQHFFGDASYTVINYRDNTGFDGHNYNFAGGVNWVATSRCQGQLMAVSRQAQAPQEELFGPGLDTVRTVSATETGQCSIYQDISAIVNSSITTTKHHVVGASAAGANALDNTTAYVQGGFSYQWPGVNSLQFLTTFTETHFDNPAVVDVAQNLNASALLNVHILNYQLVYNRTISDIFNFSAAAGVSTTGQESVQTHNITSPATPTYSVTANWLPTPKWSIQIGANRSVTPPVSIVAGTQVTDAEHATIAYFWTPKLSLTATLSRSNLAGNQNFPAANQLTQALGGFGANTLLSARLGAAYQVTPFTTATLSFQKFNRTASGENISSGIVLFGIDYQPQ